MLKRIAYILTGFVLLSCSCKDTQSSKDSLFNSFLKLSAKSTKMKIRFGDKRIESKNIIDTIITSEREMQLMKNWIQKSERSDTCYQLTGSVIFITDVNELSIDFGLSNNCPSFYYYIEGKPVTFKMPYQCGSYLGELIKR